jgi:hypothetical protein
MVQRSFERITAARILTINEAWPRFARSEMLVATVEGSRPSANERQTEGQ